jgi:membrane-associated phospholipid phosphatase
MGDVQRSEGEVSRRAGTARAGRSPVLDALCPAPLADTLPSFRTRLRCAVAITLFAALTYGATNELAHARGVTQCIALPGEMSLPLVSWLVVPYLAVDVMIALCALCATSHRQLRTLLRRVFWIFAIGNLIFLLWPLRCGFPRTIPDDWTGPLYQLLHLADRPYNQAPSLHIAEALIFAPLYLSRFPHPAAQAATLSVIVLGSAGTVLTYQHHVLDVVTGLILGGLVMKLVRD